MDGMLTKLRAAEPALPSADAVDTLLLCHQRIRHYSDLATRLADATNTTPVEIVETAMALVRYFRIALPLHVRDEEESVMPRLLALGVSLESCSAVESSAADHAMIELCVENLASVWDDLIDHPERMGAHRPALRAMAARLHNLLEIHLSVEEAEVFPRLRTHLSAATLQTIAQEMKDRRAEN